MFAILSSLILPLLAQAQPQRPSHQPSTHIATLLNTTNPVWAIPSLSISYCPLPPACTTFTTTLTVNLGSDTYSPTSGIDVLCRAEQTIGAISGEWLPCEGMSKLQWRFESFDEVTSSMTMWPRDEEGYSTIAIRLLEGNGGQNASGPVGKGQEVDVLTTSFRFRETTILTDRPDALLGCPSEYVAPIRCSMGEISVFGYTPPLIPILTDMTRVKMLV